MKRVLLSTYVIYWTYLSTIPSSTSASATAGRQQQELDLNRIPWKSTKDFPIPYDGVGDPDHILSSAAKQGLSDKLMLLHEGSTALRIKNPTATIQTTTTGGGGEGTGTSKSSSNDESDNNQDGHDMMIPIQIAIAIIERLAMDDESISTNDLDSSVEQFARNLHDQWGVGYELSPSVLGGGGGGTGVLIFLDVYDRIVYISRGGALTKILTNSRIDTIIHNMKHSLKQAKYDEGLTIAIASIADLIQKGEPSYWESFREETFQTENIFLFGWAFIFCAGVYQNWKQKRDQVAYTKAASQLSELDRAHALALQGNYQATSCPICLECFKSTTVGSDGLPIKLLRCGHVFDESCWAEWVNSGRGDVTKCPVCRMDVGAPRSDENDSDYTIVSTPTENDANDDGPSEAAVALDNERAMILYQRERNFRLLRLSQMFPRYITPNQVSQWASPTYYNNNSGSPSSLVRDPAFMNNDPSRQHQHQYSNSNGRGSNNPYGINRGFSGGTGGGFSFGGGTSGGGRSGRF